jgi:hypothetical protein
VEVGERERGPVLDLLEGEAGLDAGHAGDASQMVHEEALVGGEVGHHHAQEVVGLARHQVALHHLGALADGRLEHLEGALDLLLQRHVHEHAHG